MIEPSDTYRVDISVVCSQVNAESSFQQKRKQAIDEAGFAPVLDLTGNSSLSEDSAVRHFIDHVDDKTYRFYLRTGDHCLDLRKMIHTFEALLIGNLVRAQPMILPE